MEETNVKLYDYYMALSNLSTPLGIIKCGEIGNTSQYQDVVRFPNSEGEGTIACLVKQVMLHPHLFKGLDHIEALAIEIDRIKQGKEDIS